jgi:hypothetical protein
MGDGTGLAGQGLWCHHAGHGDGAAVAEAAVLGRRGSRAAGGEVGRPETGYTALPPPSKRL